MIYGIILGLIAATAQSCSYLASRSFLGKYHSPMSLFIHSHLGLGLLSIVALPFIFPSNMPETKSYVPFLFYVTIFYLTGQFALFRALRFAEASRISPLLGLKVVFLTIISSLFQGISYSPLQWTAVFLCMSAAVLLNWSGGAMPFKSVLWLLAACLGYSLSDLNIKFLMDAFQGIGVFRRSFLCVGLTYTVCGVVCMVIYLFFSQEKKGVRHLAASSPFAFFWFLSMLFLFGCFALIGPVFGNIIQSSRGIISILLGVAIAAMGFAHIESKVSRTVFIRRLIAGLLMTAAICLFSIAS